MARATSSLPVPASRCSHLSTSQSRVRQTRKMNCTDSTESDAALSELIAKYHEGGAYQIAEAYAFRNQSDETFERLDRAYAPPDSGLIVTKVYPLVKSLHT